MFRKKFHIPPQNKLSKFWKDYFKSSDEAIKENFWGNLSIYKKACINQDSYSKQLSEIGYSFKKGRESPAIFYQTIKWSLNKLKSFVEKKEILPSEVLIPGKAFQIDKNIVFTSLGTDIPKNAKELNLLPPDVFVKMLAYGYFPIGAPIREHTNQTLCEHDIAHIAGFISNPRYMKAIRKAFQIINEKVKENEKIKEALSNFDSLYSLRLYYMIEVFSIIPEKNHIKLEELLELKISDFSLDEPEKIYPKICDFLNSKNPSELNKYLYKIYEKFPELVDPLGGESRDILNRTRKFGRTKQSGSFYAKMSNLGSKFDGSSIYSMFLNANAALENIRSNHTEYKDAINLIHAPLLVSLIGTSQLSVEDWIFEAIKEIPDPKSKLYKYICRTGVWNESHILYWAHSNPEYMKILTNTEMGKFEIV